MNSNISGYQDGQVALYLVLVSDFQRSQPDRGEKESLTPANRISFVLHFQGQASSRNLLGDHKFKMTSVSAR